MQKAEAIVKIDSVTNWAKAKNFIPKQGTIIVYEYENESPRIKLGDGITAVECLPFLVTPPHVNQEMLEL